MPKSYTTYEHLEIRLILQDMFGLNTSEWATGRLGDRVRLITDSQLADYPQHKKPLANWLASVTNEETQ